VPSPGGSGRVPGRPFDGVDFEVGASRPTGLVERMLCCLAEDGLWTGVALESSWTEADFGGG
jgi:hypothetical protein